MRQLPEKENYVFWWSIWSKSEALRVKEKVLAENRTATITDWKPEERSFTVETGTPTVARIATFYYPRWKATVNDNPINVEMDENGVMLIPLPAEKSTVRIFFQEPLSIRIAAVFSIVAWLFIMALFLYCLREKFARLKTLNPYFAEEEFSC